MACQMNQEMRRGEAPCTNQQHMHSLTLAQPGTWRRNIASNLPSSESLGIVENLCRLASETSSESTSVMLLVFLFIFLIYISPMKVWYSCFCCILSDFKWHQIVFPLLYVSIQYDFVYKKPNPIDCVLYACSASTHLLTIERYHGRPSSRHTRTLQHCMWRVVSMLTYSWRCIFALFCFAICFGRLLFYLFFLLSLSHSFSLSLSPLSLSLSIYLSLFSPFLPLSQSVFFLLFSLLVFLFLPPLSSSLYTPFCSSLMS